MNKFILSIVGLCGVVVLTGCGATPEETYINELEMEVASLESLGELLSTLGDQLLDENFNQAYTTLGLVQDDLAEFALPEYTGEEPLLQTVADELANTIDETTVLVETLDPILAKTAENENYVASAEDLTTIGTIEALTQKIDAHITAASDAFDSYMSAVEGTDAVQEPIGEETE